MEPIQSRLSGRTYQSIQGVDKLYNFHPREEINDGQGNFHKYKLNGDLSPDEVQRIIRNNGLWDCYDQNDNLDEMGVIPNVFFKDTHISYGMSGEKSLTKSRGGWYVSYVNNMSDINISISTTKKCGVMYFIH